MAQLTIDGAGNNGQTFSNTTYSHFNMKAALVGGVWQKPTDITLQNVTVQALAPLTNASDNMVTSAVNLMIDQCTFEDWLDCWFEVPNCGAAVQNHIEGLQFGGGDGVTIQNSTFQNNETHDVFIRSWGGATTSVPAQPLRNFLIQGNVMKQTRNGFYAMQFVDDLVTAPEAPVSVRILGNAFQQGIVVNVTKGSSAHGLPQGSVEIAGNHFPAMTMFVLGLWESAGYYVHDNVYQSLNGTSPFPGDTVDPNVDLTTAPGFTGTGPINTVLPVISYTSLGIGDILTVDDGSWTGSPTSFVKTWKRNGTAIAGVGNVSQYTLQAADAGTLITVQVTATSATGSQSATSAAVGPIAPGPIPPALPNDPPVTAILDLFNRSDGALGSPWANLGTFAALTIANKAVTSSGSTTVAGMYWNAVMGSQQEVYVDVTALPISGKSVFLWLEQTTPTSATRNGYSVQYTRDTVNGDKFDIRRNAGGNTILQTVTGTNLQAGDTLLLRRLGDQVILRYGRAGVWTTLASVTDATWTHAGYIAVEATDNTTRLDNFGGGQIAAATAPTNTALPTITGNLVEDQVLTAAVGSWISQPAASYTYQWVRRDNFGANPVDITGETAATYTLATADVDHTISVKVTATNTTGSTTAQSAATAVIISVDEAIIQDLQEQIVFYQAQVAAEQIRSQQLEADVATLETALADCEASGGASQDDLDACNEAKDDLQALYDALVIEETADDATIVTLTSARDALQAEIDALEASLADILAHKDELQSLVTDLAAAQVAEESAKANVGSLTTQTNNKRDQIITEILAL